METRFDEPPSVASPWPGSAVLFKERTTSTMDDALRLARQGCPTGTVVVADYQEKGRGRVPGRTWLSAAGESLLVTVVVRTADVRFPLHELPLRAGVAVARGVEDAVRSFGEGIEVAIKWPNDLCVGGRKLAGLLCEAHGEAALVGIGINRAQRDFPAEIAASACSLLQATGRLVRTEALLTAVLSRLKEAIEAAGWREQLLGRLYRRGQSVRVDLLGSGRPIDGMLLDVDPLGRLVLRLGDGRLQTIAQGEITGP